MAWDTTLVTRLRLHIGDLDATAYVWTDAQLKQLLAIATISVDEDLRKWESVTGGPYTVDTDAPTISPDPVTNSETAPGFSNLIVIRAALITASSELRRMGYRAGIKIVDDKSTIDTTGVANALKTIVEAYKEGYADAILEFQRGNGAAGEAILSPYSSSENPWYGLCESISYCRSH